jgi:aldose 1-epimerase
MPNVTQIPAFATAILAALLHAAPVPAASAPTVTESSWGRLPDGRPVRAFTLTNAQGTRVVLAEYGALLVSVETPDREGRIGHVTLFYQSLEEALAGGVFGSVIGRFANRISGGGFTIDGERHDLESVNGDGVHIHGGKTGFHRQLWQGRAEEGGVTFSLASEDGHEGYPGKVEVSVTYTLTNDSTLRLTYTGTTGRTTPLNLTNHVYFNLSGTGDIRGHELHMDCAEVLAVDSRKVPTGARLPVAGTPFDFRTAKPVGRDIGSVEGGGYDHCFVIPRGAAGKGGEPVAFATLSDPVSGRTLEIATTKPGVQIFTANSFNGSPYPRWGGICFETQFYPDSPNRPEFPSCLLRPGERYAHVTEFRFGVSP